MFKQLTAVSSLTRHCLGPMGRPEEDMHVHKTGYNHPWTKCTEINFCYPFGEVDAPNDCLHPSGITQGVKMHTPCTSVLQNNTAKAAAIDVGDWHNVPLCLYLSLNILWMFGN